MQSSAIKKYAGMSAVAFFSVFVQYTILSSLSYGLASLFSSITSYGYYQYAGVFLTLIASMLPSGVIGAVFLLMPRGDWKVFAGIMVFMHGYFTGVTAPLYPSATDFDIWAFVVFNGIFEISVLATGAHALYGRWKERRSKTYAIG